MTSIPATSTTTPRARVSPTRLVISSRSSSTSTSLRADWMDAIRKSPCFRIGTAIPASLFALGQRFGRNRHVVTEQSLGFFEAALQVPDRLHHAEVDAQIDECLRGSR